jgi:hypothetical protein
MSSWWVFHSSYTLLLASVLLDVLLLILTKRHTNSAKVSSGTSWRPKSATNERLTYIHVHRLCVLASPRRRLVNICAINLTSSVFVYITMNCRSSLALPLWYLYRSTFFFIYIYAHIPFRCEVMTLSFVSLSVHGTWK